MIERRDKRPGFPRESVGYYLIDSTGFTNRAPIGSPSFKARPLNPAELKHLDER